MARAILRGVRESLRCLLSWYLNSALTPVRWLMWLDKQALLPGLHPPAVLISSKRGCIVILLPDDQGILPRLQVLPPTNMDSPLT